MMKWRRLCAAVLLMVACTSCATLQQFAALRNVAFSLDGVQDGRLAGVRLDRIGSYEDLSALEIGRLAIAVARKDLPLEFRLNVRAENPSGNATSATLARLSWSLLLDDQETISGVLDDAYTLRPGEPVVIPLHMSLDLIDFVDGSAESLVNIAAAIAGFDADPTRLALRAIPTIDTPLGPMSYPSGITVVSQTIGGGMSEGGRGEVGPRAAVFPIR